MSLQGRPMPGHCNTLQGEGGLWDPLSVPMGQTLALLNPPGEHGNHPPFPPQEPHFTEWPFHRKKCKEKGLATYLKKKTILQMLPKSVEGPGLPRCM